MKPFALERINKIAPYEVSIEGKQFVFNTLYGLHYEVRFFEEQPIGGCETWQFSFAKANSDRRPFFRKQIERDGITIIPTTTNGQKRNGGFHVFVCRSGEVGEGPMSTTPCKL